MTTDLDQAKATSRERKRCGELQASIIAEGYELRLKRIRTDHYRASAWLGSGSLSQLAHGASELEALEALAEKLK